VVAAHGILGDGELDAFGAARKLVPARPTSNFSDPTHANRVVIASGQTGLSRRGAGRGRMKAVEFKTRFSASFCSCGGYLSRLNGNSQKNL
jgi:hypothetical protein